MESEPRTPEDDRPSSAFSWLIVFCSFVVLVTYGANWVMFSVYYTEFTEVFGMPQAHVAVIGSMDAAFSQLIALPTNAMVPMCGARLVCIVGLLIYTVGTFLSVFTSNFYVMLVTFGIVKGWGAGMIYVPALTIVQEYFTKNRSLAAGISSCGLSIGTLAFGPIHRLLINHFGWRGAMLLSTAIPLQAVVFAGLMRPLPRRKRDLPGADAEAIEMTAIKQDGENLEEAEPLRSGDCDLAEKPTEDTSTGSTSNLSACDKLKQYVARTLAIENFTDPDFVLYEFSTGLAVSGILAMFKFSIARNVYAGFDKMLAAFFVTLVGITSSVSRLLAGIVGNLKCVNRLLLYSISVTSGGVVVIFTIFCGNSSVLHAIMHIAYGVFMGSHESLIPTVGTDLFTVDKLPVTLGWLLMICGAVAFLYMPLFGWTVDLTGSFDVGFVLGGGMQIVAGCFGFIIFVRQRLRKRKSSACPTETVTVELPALTESGTSTCA